MFAKQASKKLQEILLKAEKEEDLDRVLDLMIELAKEIQDTQNKKPEYNDPFFTSIFLQYYLMMII